MSSGENTRGTGGSGSGNDDDRRRGILGQLNTDNTGRLRKTDGPVRRRSAREQHEEELREMSRAAEQRRGSGQHRQLDVPAREATPPSQDAQRRISRRNLLEPDFTPTSAPEDNFNELANMVTPTPQRRRSSGARNTASTDLTGNTQQAASIISNLTTNPMLEKAARLKSSPGRTSPASESDSSDANEWGDEPEPTPLITPNTVTATGATSQNRPGSVRNDNPNYTETRAALSRMTDLNARRAAIQRFENPLAGISPAGQEVIANVAEPVSNAGRNTERRINELSDIHAQLRRVTVARNASQQLQAADTNAQRLVVETATTASELNSAVNTARQEAREAGVSNEVRPVLQLADEINGVVQRVADAAEATAEATQRTLTAMLQHRLAAEAIRNSNQAETEATRLANLAAQHALQEQQSRAKGAIKIQKLARGFQAKKKVQTIKRYRAIGDQRENAVLKIQKNFRGTRDIRAAKAELQTLRAEAADRNERAQQAQREEDARVARELEVQRQNEIHRQEQERLHIERQAAIEAERVAAEAARVAAEQQAAAIAAQQAADAANAAAAAALAQAGRGAVRMGRR